MQNDGLQDLMLNEHENNKRTNLKRLLMIIAGFVILFLVVVAIVGVFQSSSDESNSLAQRPALPPAPAQKQSASQGNEGLFEQVPIVEEKPSDDDFEAMIKRLKSQERTEQSKAANQKPATKQDTPKQTKPAPAAPSAKATQNAKPEKQQSSERSVFEPSQQPSPSPKEPKPAASAQPGQTPKGAYVQVAAATKPAQSYLDGIKQKGYEYVLFKVGTSFKVLIGPYSESEIRAQLGKIRNDLAKDAFIFRVK